MEHLYLDAASTEPVGGNVISVMMPFLIEAYANPMSVHSAGKTAARALEAARGSIAADLGARPDDVIFTSGGTEADNLAIKGIAMARIRLLRESYGEQVRPRIIVSSIEHPAVLESARWMERWFGCEVVEIPVDHQVHIDLDALSLSGHKFGTPKGLGALLLRSRVSVEPLMSGGGQERSLRSGTQNVAGAVALAVALRDLNTRMHEIGRALVASRDRLIDAVLRVEPRAQLTGDSQRRLLGHASFVFPGLSGEALLVDLDARGIACSSGSACAVGRHEAPGTLLAMGYDPAVAKSAIRMTFREPLTPEQINQIASVVEESCNSLRGASTVSDPSINVQAQQALA